MFLEKEIKEKHLVIVKNETKTRKLINFFRSTVESILLYGAETWAMTKTMNSEIDGTYTRLLRHALNINWRQHVTNENLCGDFPKISSVIQQQRLRLAGHCYRSDKTVTNLILWKPKHGYRRPYHISPKQKLLILIYSSPLHLHNSTIHSLEKHTLSGGAFRPTITVIANKQINLNNDTIARSNSWQTTVQIPVNSSSNVFV